MLLALPAGVLHQARIIEPLGLLEHRARDIDLVVESQCPDDPRRRVADRCEADREQRPRRHLDLDRQTDENVVEQRDLLLAALRRADDEEVGNVPHDLATTAERAARHGVLDFAHELGGRGHR